MSSQALAARILFPYKPAVMRRAFDTFAVMLQKRAADRCMPT